MAFIICKINIKYHCFFAKLGETMMAFFSFFHKKQFCKYYSGSSQVKPQIFVTSYKKQLVAKPKLYKLKMSLEQIKDPST